MVAGAIGAVAGITGTLAGLLTKTMDLRARQVDAWRQRRVRDLDEVRTGFRIALSMIGWLSDRASDRDRKQDISDLAEALNRAKTAAALVRDPELSTRLQAWGRAVWEVALTAHGDHGFSEGQIGDLADKLMDRLGELYADADAATRIPSRRAAGDAAANAAQ